MKILFLNSERIEHLYESVKNIYGQFLRNKGFDVIFVSPTENTTIKPGTVFVDDAGNKHYLFRKPKSLGTKQLLSYYLDLKNVLLKLENQAILTQLDIVIVRDDPLLLKEGLNLSKRYGIPVIFSLSHLKEEEIMMKSKKISNLVYAYISLITRNRLMKKTNNIITISNQMRHTLHLLYKVPYNKMYVIQEGVSKNFINHEINNKIQKPFRKEIVFGYIGTLNEFRQPELMLELLDSVISSGIAARLVIVTNSNQFDIKKFKEITMRRFPNIEKMISVISNISHRDISKYIDDFDFGLCLNFKNKVLINNSFIKVIEYLARGKPVIASDTPENQELAILTKAIILVDCDQHEHTKKIAKLLKDQDFLNDLFKNASLAVNFVETNRTFEILGEKLKEIILHTINNDSDRHT